LVNVLELRFLSVLGVKLFQELSRPSDSRNSSTLKEDLKNSRTFQDFAGIEGRRRLSK